MKAVYSGKMRRSMPILWRYLVVLAAGFASAASLGKLVPHLDWMVQAFAVPLGAALGQWGGAQAAGADPLRAIGIAHAVALIAAAFCILFFIKIPLTAGRAPPSRDALLHRPALYSALAMGTACGVLLAAVAL